VINSSIGHIVTSALAVTAAVSGKADASPATSLAAIQEAPKPTQSAFNSLPHSTSLTDMHSPAMGRKILKAQVLAQQSDNPSQAPSEANIPSEVNGEYWPPFTVDGTDAQPISIPSSKPEATDSKLQGQVLKGILIGVGTFLGGAMVMVLAGILTQALKRHDNSSQATNNIAQINNEPRQLPEDQLDSGELAVEMAGVGNNHSIIGNTVVLDVDAGELAVDISNISTDYSIDSDAAMPEVDGNSDLEILSQSLFSQSSVNVSI